MSIYKYAGASAVQEVRFRYANDRPPEAMLVANPNAGADQLATIKHALQSFGYEAVPAVAEGKEILQVTGFADEGQLGAFLKVNHFTQSDPVILPEAGDHPTRSMGDWLKHNSLKAAGWLNMIGDVGLLASGIRTADAEKITAGALYTSGAAIAARYGNVRTEHQVRQVMEQTTKFLKQQAIDLPADSGLYSIAHQKRQGTFHDAENFLYHYPAEMMLGTYTMGAFAMLQSGLRKTSAGGKHNPWNIAYGASSLSLKAGSLLIPERQRSDEEKREAKNHTPIGKVIDWIQEKPMRLFGFGSFISDTFLGLSAYRDHKNHPQQAHDIFMWITTGTYLVADVLAAISSKDPSNADGKFNADEQRRIEAMVAETIVRQPEPMQLAMTNQIAGFLATQPEMRGNVASISESITEQVKHQAHNPWAQRVSMEVASTQQSAR